MLLDKVRTRVSELDSSIPRVSPARPKERTTQGTVYFLGGYHPVNESFIRSPPANVRLTSRVPVEAFQNFQRAGESDSTWKSKKKLADLVFGLMNRPRTVPVFGRYDLIHTNGSIIPLSLSPWVASVENPSAFYGFNESWHESPAMRRRLAKYLVSHRCRAILPYTEASAEYLRICLSDWKSDLNAKMQVLYPAIDRYLVTDKVPEEKEEDAPVNFLFVGNHFFDKGGREAIKAFESVRERGRCTLTLVTSAPEHQRKEFEEVLPLIKRQEGVTFFSTGLPRERLLELFRAADVFLFPSYMDQVPFVLLEAMASALPLIGSNSFGMPEMCIDQKNGLVVTSPWLAFPKDKPRTVGHLEAYRKAVMDEGNFSSVVEELTDKMTTMVAKPQLRTRFAKESLEMVTSGRFSTLRRNEQLGRIYDQCITR